MADRFFLVARCALTGFLAAFFCRNMAHTLPTNPRQAQTTPPDTTLASLCRLADLAPTHRTTTTTTARRAAVTASSFAATAARALSTSNA